MRTHQNSTSFSLSSFEKLETRQLMSAVVTATGTLTIAGTPQDDHISVEMRDRRIRVVLNDIVAEFDSRRVRRVRVDAGAGRDTIEQHTKLRSTILGGAASDTLLGGMGRDEIWGGGGNDRIRGNKGNDTLLGGNGNDRLYGSGGADQLIGGRGNDKLLGQAGIDTLLGQQGGDTLSGGPDVGHIEGNGGLDTAIVDQLGASVAPDVELQLFHSPAGIIAAVDKTAFAGNSKIFWEFDDGTSLFTANRSVGRFQTALLPSDTPESLVSVQVRDDEYNTLMSVAGEFAGPDMPVDSLPLEKLRQNASTTLESNIALVESSFSQLPDGFANGSIGKALQQSVQRLSQLKTMVDTTTLQSFDYAKPAKEMNQAQSMTALVTAIAGAAKHSDSRAIVARAKTSEMPSLETMLGQMEQYSVVGGGLFGMVADFAENSGARLTSELVKGMSNAFGVANLGLATGYLGVSLIHSIDAFRGDPQAAAQAEAEAWKALGLSASFLGGSAISGPIVTALKTRFPLVSMEYLEAAGEVLSTGIGVQDLLNDSFENLTSLFSAPTGPGDPVPTPAPQPVPTPAPTPVSTLILGKWSGNLSLKLDMSVLDLQGIEQKSMQELNWGLMLDVAGSSGSPASITGTGRIAGQPIQDLPFDWQVNDSIWARGNISFQYPLPSNISIAGNVDGSNNAQMTFALPVIMKVTGQQSHMENGFAITEDINQEAKLYFVFTLSGSVTQQSFNGEVRLAGYEEGEARPTEPGEVQGAFSLIRA